MSISNINAKRIHSLTYLFIQYTFIDSVSGIEQTQAKKKKKNHDPSWGLVEKSDKDNNPIKMAWGLL